MIGETLLIVVEEDNRNDPRAVAVVKSGVVVDHMPREAARTVYFFLRRGGTGTCDLTGRRRKGKGLEVPCMYTSPVSCACMKLLKSLLSDGRSPILHASSWPY